MKILVFAPHNDDEVLGVGGSIAKMSSFGHEVTICEVTSGNVNDELVKRIKNEALKAHQILGVKKSIFLDLPVVGLREMPTKTLNEAILKIVNEEQPELVFIPHKGDMHFDHRMVAEACMVALRPFSCPTVRGIYAYETLSETEWNSPSVENAFIPNVYSDISNYLDLKIKAMMCYETQLRDYPHPRSIEAIEALASYRGTNVCFKYAEAFVCLRSFI